MSPPLLAVEGVTAGYGRATILDGIDLAIPEGGGLALLGRNGVGKTTLIRTLMGLTDRTAGRILWRGRDVAGLPAAERVRLGLGWVPQERRIFRTLSVQENLEVAARPGPWDLARVYALLPRLAERRANQGWQLSGGEQQLLALGRALMLNPDLLLLDEPLEGLAPVMVDVVLDAIRELAGTGLALVMVEQHAADALELTGHAVVMDRGRIVARAGSAALLADPARIVELTGL
ncbi:ABC transporter ATP-binding protein [Methylobacterium oryzihabitans]|uniref:ABC transporter ATP-binding protein n=1 Tax=Methylobacterium oryzihabitans TaxID=2499852 RepID=UPI001AEDAF0D|nr:ABC transporter ATP-binding protein [Methylobacterium oryzihabitans]